MTTQHAIHHPPRLDVHRLFAALFAAALAALIVTGCGGAPSRAMPSMPAAMAPAPAAEAPEMAPAAASENGFSDVNTDRALTTSSHVRAWADDLLGTASRFRSEVYRLDGYVVSERIDFEDKLRVRKSKLPTRASREERSKAIFAVSVPIDNLPPLLDWVRGHSIVVEQFVAASRDGSVPTPDALAAQAQQRELQKQQIAQRLAQVEQQLTQAGDAERPSLEAERAALQGQLAQLDQAIATPTLPAVKYSTVNVYLESDQPQIRFNAAWVVPSLRASLLVTDLLGSDPMRQARVGAAVGFALPSPTSAGGMFPAPLLELAGYPGDADRDAGVTATLGIGKYARSMGDGQNTWFNPFAGFRMGYAYLGDHAFLIAGELGVELFKSSGVALSASIRPQGLIGSDSQVALEAGSNLSFAF